MALAYDDLVETLTATYPDVEWSYVGDGTTLDGLAWPDDQPPTLDDLEASFEQARREAVRAAKLAEIKAALYACDWWAARAYEESVAMTDERIAYRQALRDLFQEVAALDVVLLGATTAETAAATRTALEEVVLPDVPAAPVF